MRFFALLLLLLTGPLAAGADEVGDLGVTIKANVQVGDRPAVVLMPSVGVAKVILALEGPSRQTLKAGPVGVGQRKELPLTQGVGAAQWTANGNVTWADGSSGTFTLTFETHVFPKIAADLAKRDVDLENRRLTARLNQPCSKIEYRVMGDDGKVMDEGVREVDIAAGETIEIEWAQTPGIAVLKIDVKLWSAFNFWVSVEITPFEVEIPHEDVEFESGRWAVRPSEVPKLRHTLDLLSEKVARYGGLIKLQLYVAGYTDRVGSHGSNQELSEQRARAIGSWFRANGLKLPIYYQGFGESVLAVETPDETSEARNRRALYVLSAGAPGPQPSVPRQAWRPL